MFCGRAWSSIRFHAVIFWISESIGFQGLELLYFQPSGALEALPPERRGFQKSERLNVQELASLDAPPLERGNFQGPGRAADHNFVNRLRSGPHQGPKPAKAQKRKPSTGAGGQGLDRRTNPAKTGERVG